MKLLAAKDNLPHEVPMTVAEHIAAVGNVRWAYRDAQFYWFVGGDTQDEHLLSRMRYRITRDVTTLGARCLRRRQQPVALITQTEAAPLIVQMLAKFPGWKSIVFGTPDMQIENANTVCANTADVILCYGTPSETLMTILDGMEQGPELVQRKIADADRLKQPIRHGGDPYSQFWTDVERLRHDRPNPLKGLQIRDEIDMRPQFRV